MAKASGNTRIVKPFSGKLKKNMAEYLDNLNLGYYDQDKSTPPTENNAYILISKDRNYDENEFFVAKVLSENMYNVKLTSEKDVLFATYIDKKGNPHFSEGTISMYTYEQRTPSKIDTTTEASVKQAIMHANSKHSQVALIYDKNNFFHRKDIENGIRKYKKEHRAWKNAGAKTVIVINNKGKIYEHIII